MERKRSLPFVLFLLLVMIGCSYTPLVGANTDVKSVQQSLSMAPRNMQFSRITQQQGLSQGAINGIAQDHKGYIWLGTQEGLNRYDGYEMVVYEHRRDDGGSLSHDWVWSVYVDSAGTVWAGTDGGGLNRYDPEAESFAHFRHNPEDLASLSNDRVRVIFQDSRGDYWVGTDGGGLNRFDTKSGKFSHYRHDSENPESLPSDTVLAIFEDSKGKLWIGTDNGLARMGHAQKKFVVYHHDTADAGSLSNNQVRSIYEDRRGRFWVGTYEGGLNLFNPHTNSFRRFQHDPLDPHSLSHDRVRDIFQDREGTLWVATDKGLNEWRPEQGGFVHYRHNPTHPSSISDDRLTRVFQDQGDVLWVGTFNGLNKWNYVSDAFDYLRVEQGSSSELSGNIITVLEEGSNDIIWIGVYGGGLNRIDLTTGKMKHFKHSADDKASLSDDRVMALLVDHDQSIWVGTRNGGLNHLDRKTGQFTRYQHDPDDASSLSSNGITSILRDSEGTLWVGTYGGGLNRFEHSDKTFRRYQNDPENPKTISSDRITAIYQDRSNGLWIGTEEAGLNRFNYVADSFARYLHAPIDDSSLSSNAVLNMMESEDGALWIATMGGGLNRWTLSDRKSNQPVFQHFHKAKGLKSDTVFGMLEDKDGFIWLSSNRGLSRLNPIDGSMRHFDRFNGLRGDEFNFGAFLKTRSGRLFFGGTDGLVTFDPGLLLVNMHRPEIVLTAHSKHERLTTAYSTDEGEPETLMFGYKDDYVSFKFAALDFASSDKNQYRYKLDGFDDEWIDPRDIRSATYTSLPAGHYVFMVKAANNDGIWNEEGVSVRLQVEPPPWQTPWAYSMYTLFIGGTLVTYKKKQDKKHDKAKKYSAKLEGQVEARTQELSERYEELKELNHKLQEASVTDSLTGLKNRRYLYESIEARVASITRRVEDTLTTDTRSNTIDLAPSMFFMMIDLDGFKSINDTYGHAAGDKALIQVRDILQATCRKSDIIVRWGGDEFLIVGENTSLRAAEQLADRIRHNLAEHQYQLGGGNVGRLSGSIGFSMYPFSPLKKANLLTWEQVVALADHSAYTAKKNGRNGWVGVYGTRKSAWEEFAKTDIDIIDLAAKGMLSIRSSHEKLIETAKKSQHAEG